MSLILTDCLGHDPPLCAGLSSDADFLGWMLQTSSKLEFTVLLALTIVFMVHFVLTTQNHKSASGCTGIYESLYLFCLIEVVTFVPFLVELYLRQHTCHCWTCVVLCPWASTLNRSIFLQHISFETEMKMINSLHLQD